MPVIIFFRGPPGSGKGGFAQELAYLVKNCSHIESGQFFQETNYNIFKAHRRAQRMLHKLSRQNNLDLVTVSGVFGKTADFKRYLKTLPQGVRIIMAETAEFSLHPWVKQYLPAPVLLERMHPYSIELIQNYKSARDLLSLNL